MQSWMKLGDAENGAKRRATRKVCVCGGVVVVKVDMADGAAVGDRGVGAAGR